jgi:hypothetical protein
MDKNITGGCKTPNGKRQRLAALCKSAKRFCYSNQYYLLFVVSCPRLSAHTPISDVV